MSQSDYFSRYRLKRKISDISHPIKAQLVKRMGNKDFRVSSAIMQGLRPEMEDGHSVQLSLENHPNTAYFGLFDGHNGAKASEWCQDHFHKYIDKIDEYTEDKIKKCALEADKDFLSQNSVTDGTTAVFGLVTKVESKKKKSFQLTVGNIGDSRCILVKGGSSNEDFEIMSLTVDHKPDGPEETQRIEKAGGLVARGRVDGILAVSRAIGDSRYKERTDLPPEEQRVISVPAITRVDVGKNDFLLLCCDGVFEGLSDEEAITFIKKEMEQTSDTGVILSKLLYLALEKKTKDNLTAILVQFINGEDWNQKDQFLPGDFPEEPNGTYQNSYKTFVENCGYTFEQCKEMIEKKLRKEFQKTKTLAK